MAKLKEVSVCTGRNRGYVSYFFEVDGEVYEVYWLPGGRSVFLEGRPEFAWPCDFSKPLAGFSEKLFDSLGSLGFWRIRFPYEDWNGEYALIWNSTVGKGIKDCFDRLFQTDFMNSLSDEAPAPTGKGGN